MTGPGILVGLSTVGLTVALLCWAFASPVASSPDDDLHIANVYCIHDATTCRSDDWSWPWQPPAWAASPTDRKGPEYAGAYDVYSDLWQYSSPRELPCYVSNGQSWYAPDPSVAATCLNGEDRMNNRPSTLDQLGYYPNFYYRLLSVFARSTIRESVATWRVLNVALAVIMVSVSVLLTNRYYRRTVTMAALIASVPLGLFLMSSINPSAWLLIGSASFLGPAVTQLRVAARLNWQTAGRVAFMALCLVMMVAGRSEGPAHAGVVVLVALILGLKASRRVWVFPAGLTTVAVLLGAGVVYNSGTAKFQSVTQVVTDGIARGSLWDSLLTAPSFFFGSDAIRLGWLDVVPPATAIIASQAAFWGAAVLGLAVMFWRKGLAIALVAGILLTGPALLVAGGSQTPPTRYFLPLVYMLAFALLFPRWNHHLPRWQPAQWLALGAAVVLANSLSLLYLTVRYVSGLGAGTTNPKALAAAGTPAWWWGGWLDPFTNWLVGSLAFAVAVAALFSLFWTAPRGLVSTGALSGGDGNRRGDSSGVAP